jgi:hypothetical protein
VLVDTFFELVGQKLLPKLFDVARLQARLDIAAALGGKVKLRRLKARIITRGIQEDAAI